MTDEFKFQLSVSIPSGEQYEKGDMINVRANSPQEFSAYLQAFQDTGFATLAAEAAANIKAAYLVARDLGGSQVSHQRQSAPQGPQNGAGGPNTAPQGGYAPQAPNGPQNGSQGYQGGYQQQQPQGYQQGGYQQQPQQPQGNGVPTTPPPHVGPAPQCSHGVKQFLAKPYKNGKPGYWMAWACPAQQGDPTQHELEFIPKK